MNRKTEKGTDSCIWILVYVAKVSGFFFVFFLITVNLFYRYSKILLIICIHFTLSQIKSRNVNVDQKILAYFDILYHRSNVLCCKERSPQKKKYSNSKVREENIAVVFIQLWLLQLEKFLLPSSRWWRGVCESWLFDTRLLQQIGRSRLGYNGSGPPEPLTHPFWQLPSTPPKSHYLFSYIEILENKSKIRECSMSLVKHVILHLWLF